MAKSTLPQVEVAQASETEAELAAHIDQELGLKPVPVPEPPKDDNQDDTTDTTEEVDIPETEEGINPEEGESTGEENAEEVEQEEVAEEERKPAAPSTPSDEELSIEVVDADGVTHKISVIEDLPEDFSPKNNRQILEIVSQLSKLDAKRETQAIETEKAQQEALIQETKEAQFKSWDAEIAELAKDKRITSTDTERVNAVFGYMNEINNARIKAGNPNLVTSFEDALDKFEVKEAKDNAEAAKKNETEKAKAKASLIGRSSASANGDNYVYRAGSARSIDDIPV